MLGLTLQVQLKKTEIENGIRDDKAKVKAEASEDVTWTTPSTKRNQLVSVSTW
jgi:hypothetical protein